MLPDKSKDLLPLLVMLESIGKIKIYSRQYDNALDFYVADDQVKFNASLLLLSNLGEYTQKISIQLKDEYGTVDWKKIKNFRNRIAHDYIGIDFDMVFEIIKLDLLDLEQKLEKIVSEKLLSNVFIKEEFIIAQKSSFYKHISFVNILV